MGILNVTPDSFFDGGAYINSSQALRRGLMMVEQGADIIDVGGESTRPGASLVSTDEELSRVIPVIEKICQETDTIVSIDTSKPIVMQEAVKAGAKMINDVFALQKRGALEVASELDVMIVLMHMLGDPCSMQQEPCYEESVVREINSFFETRIQACLDAGIAKQRLILDPGFGFGKTNEHNLELIRYFDAFQKHQLPVLLGVSRKSTLGAILNKNASERLVGSLVLTILSVMQGMAMIRTHDVDETVQAIQVLEALRKRSERL